MRQTTNRGIDDNRKVGTVKPSVNDMFMYTPCIRINMAKLYWRIKKNGKWTWQAAMIMVSHLNDDEDGSPVYKSYEVRELEGQ